MVTNSRQSCQLSHSDCVCKSLEPLRPLPGLEGRQEVLGLGLEFFFSTLAVSGSYIKKEDILFLEIALINSSVR